MRAQIKMFETVGVLVVFFFLLIMGALFYFEAQKSALEKERIISSEKYALQIVLKALYMPELDCSFLVTKKDNCIDKIKLYKMAKMLKDDEVINDYFQEFGHAKITVKQIWPETGETVKLYDYEILDEEGKPAYSADLKTQNPILLYDPWRDSYAFGEIEVGVYIE